MSKQEDTVKTQTIIDSTDSNGAKSAMRKFVTRILLIGGSLVVVSNGAHMFMTWLIEKEMKLDQIFLRSEIEFLGTSLICLIILFFVFYINYRKRQKEISTLSENIQRVASGDFSSQIEYSNRDSMADVYRDFNKMSAELSAVQFLKTDFINHFSHEFKTPLASINGFASLMLEKELPKETQTEYLKIIQEESERLTNLTRNTILLSKLSSREYLSSTEHFDLGEQLRQCSIILSHEWMKKNQVFSGDFPKASFFGNRELLQHLWLNIIGNAIRYTPAGGEISVTLTVEPTCAIVKVTDNGEGMTQETLDHLFLPYYQGISSNSKQGLGVGLAIAKQIVTLCEGTIEVESIPHEGSTFTINLPLLPESTNKIH